MLHKISVLLAYAIVSPLVSANSVAPCITLPVDAPNGAGQPLPDFMSYSIELSSFPDFAGKVQL
jgi:hypothetical protein